MTTEQITNLKQEIRQALEHTADHQVLTEIVRRCYESGGTKSEVYETLEQIWKKYGFDDDEHSDPCPLRDALEFVMERVWYWGL